jgi:hypothetical protein
MFVDPGVLHRVFNRSTGLVEVSCDIVFDETNGSQVEQVDLDELDDEEAPLGMCVLRNPRASTNTRSTVILYTSIATNSR